MILNGSGATTMRKTDLDTLVSYDWLGNIRQLKDIIERAVIISDTDTLNLSDLLFGTRQKPLEDLHHFKPLIDILSEHIFEAIQYRSLNRNLLQA